MYERRPALDMGIKALKNDEEESELKPKPLFLEDASYIDSSLPLSSKSSNIYVSSNLV